MSQSADDLIHFRMRLLSEIEGLQQLLAAVARERGEMAAESAALELELSAHSTALAVAGVGLRRQTSLLSVGSASAAQAEAAIVAAEMYASVDVKDAGIADEESLRRLLAALEKSELELAELARQAASATAVAGSEAGAHAALATPVDGGAVAELPRLRAEIARMQPLLRPLSSAAPRL